MFLGARVDCQESGERGYCCAPTRALKSLETIGEQCAQVNKDEHSSLQVDVVAISAGQRSRGRRLGGMSREQKLPTVRKPSQPGSVPKLRVRCRGRPPLRAKSSMTVMVCVGGECGGMWLSGRSEVGKDMEGTCRPLLPQHGSYRDATTSWTVLPYFCITVSILGLPDILCPSQEILRMLQGFLPSIQLLRKQPPVAQTFNRAVPLIRLRSTLAGMHGPSKQHPTTAWHLNSSRT